MKAKMRKSTQQRKKIIPGDKDLALTGTTEVKDLEEAATTAT